MERTSVLRKLLRVRENSSIAPLFSETGVAPIRFRRADLALRMLGYALQQDEGSLVRCALTDSLDLAARGARSWYGDLMKALELLPEPVVISYQTSVEAVEAARARLVTATKQFVKNAVAENTKLDLLVGRPDPRRREGDPWGSAPIMELRQYLKIPIPAHRDALTRLLVSEHNLAVERLRYVGVARKDRRCRFCRFATEDPSHALFSCDGCPEISALRAGLYKGLIGKGEREGLRLISELEPKKAIQHLASAEGTLPMFARYVRDVLRCFDAVEPLVLDM